MVNARLTWDNCISPYVPASATASALQLLSCRANAASKKADTLYVAPAASKSATYCLHWLKGDNVWFAAVARPGG